MRWLFIFIFLSLEVNANYSPYSKEISTPSLISADSNLTLTLEGVSDTTSDNEVTYESLLDRFEDLYTLASLNYTEASTYESSGTSLDWNTLGVFSLSEFSVASSLPSSAKFVSMNGRISIANVPESSNSYFLATVSTNNIPLFGYWGVVTVTSGSVSSYYIYPYGLSISSGSLSSSGVSLSLPCSGSNVVCNEELDSITIKYLE